MTAPDAVRLNDVSEVTLMSGHPTTVHIQYQVTNMAQFASLQTFCT